MPRKYAKAKREIAQSGASAEAIAEAQSIITRLQEENARLSIRLVETERRAQAAERKAAWSEGRRGDGIDRVPGFTITETRVLRILCAHGEIRYERFESLQRHMSNIRKKLPPGIKIKTIVQQGYEVTSGLHALKRMVSGEILTVRPLDGLELRAVA
jgi:hypothetical protein